MISLVSLLGASFVANAQIDIATLEGLTTAQITDLVGQPLRIIDVDMDPDLDQIDYKDTQIFQRRTSNSLDYIHTTSDRFCVLSNLVEGGIKVGDSLEKLKAIDFAKTEYGRGKLGNRLQEFNRFEWEIGGHTVNYWIFSQECERIFLAVSDGIVKAWSYNPVEDATGYDLSVHLLNVKDE